MSSELVMVILLVFLHVSGPNLVVWTDALTNSIKMKYSKELWFRKMRLSWLYVEDFFYIVRAKCILQWHLSWIGNKVDRLSIQIRMDKDPSGITMDMSVLPYLNDMEQEAYKNNCEERKNFAFDTSVF